MRLMNLLSSDNRTFFGSVAALLFLCASEAPATTPVVSSPTISEASVPAPVGAFTKWRTDADQKKKVLDDKKILVDATTTEEEGSKALMQVSAVGFIDVPFRDVKRWVKDYPDLKNVDERFREVSWNPSKKELFLHMEAYSYHAQMKLKVAEISTDDAFLMDWECIEGNFLGMKGLVRLEKEGKGAVLSLDSAYSADRLPLPKVLMGAGLEFVASRVAGKMRSHLEDKWKKGDPQE
ncbi:MAG: hypothetical protein K2X47_03115 [Bdellovibrionales bacterium]|nr:hypothetical protein [Bdellovibrionales bacterium]